MFAKLKKKSEAGRRWKRTLRRSAEGFLYTIFTDRLYFGMRNIILAKKLEKATGKAMPTIEALIAESRQDHLDFMALMKEEARKVLEGEAIENE